MLTKTLLALKATLSQRPDTKQHKMMGISERAGSISSPSAASHPRECCAGCAIAEEFDDSPELSTPGVLEGVFLVAGILASMANTQLFSPGSLSLVRPFSFEL